MRSCLLLVRLHESMQTKEIRSQKLTIVVNGSIDIGIFAPVIVIVIVVPDAISGVVVKKSEMST